MKKVALPAALAVLLLALLCAGIQEAALHGHQGWSLARRGVAARNFVRRGLVATRGAPVESPAGTAERDFVWYANHPALTSLLVAAAIGALGPAEWAERSVPILFTAAWFLVLFDLARRRRGTLFAVVTGLSAIAMPIVTYYGSFVNHEPIVLFATVAMVASYDAVRAGRRGGLALLAASVALGVLDDWSFLFVLAPFLALAAVDGRRRKDLGALWTMLAAGAAAGGIVVAHALSIPGESLALFGERLLGRSTLNLGFLEVVTNPAVPNRFPMLLTPLGAIAALLCPVLAILRLREGRADILDAAMAAIWAGAAAYCVLLSEGLRNHDYWCFLFAPCAALGLATIVQELRRPRVVAMLVLSPTLAWGLVALWDFRRLPSELVEEWPDFRFGENLVMRHVHRRTRAGQSVLVEEAVYMQHQARWHLDRPWMWFRGQEGLGDWAVAEGASMIVLPAATADGGALAELGRSFRLTAFEDHWIVDLRRGPGAVDARRVVHARASLAWRILRSLVYSPYRVRSDRVRSAELTEGLWARLGRHVDPSLFDSYRALGNAPRGEPRDTEADSLRRSERPAAKRSAGRPEGPRENGGRGGREPHALEDARDVDAALARENAGLPRPVGLLPVRLSGSGPVAEVVGARIERQDGGVVVWLVVRARAAAVPPRPVVWASEQPETAADRELWPRVPEAWWRPGRLYAYRRALGLTRGPHALWLRRSDALGIRADVPLATVQARDRLPVLGRW